MTKRVSLAGIVLASALALSACASGGGSSELVDDPFETFNRDVHEFNKGMDMVLLRPLSQVYDLMMPTLFKHMIGNAFNHLALPGTFVNHLLQGDTEDAASTFGRFAVNTLVGAGGTLDPATEFGLPMEATDFGLTLAAWGVEEGPYIELPLLGPSTVRDALGTVVDTALSPTTYVSGGSEATIVSATGTALKTVDGRDRAKMLIDDLLYNSEDSYISFRASYIQNRRRKASDGQTSVAELPDLFAD